MRYFDRFVDAAIEKDASGNSLFFPWGVFGRGFIVESEKNFELIRKIIKNVQIMNIFTSIVPVFLFIPLSIGIYLSNLFFIALGATFFISILIFAAWYCFSVKPVTAQLQEANEKLKTLKTSDKWVWFFKFPTSVFFDVFLVVIISGGIFLNRSGLTRFWNEPLSIYFFAGISGPVALFAGYQIFSKIRRK